MRDLKRKKPATYEDIEELPIGWVGELVEDELYAHPRPAVAHLHVASRLGAHLISHFEEGLANPGGWWLLNEPELHLGRDVLVPDIAGWRRERVPSGLDLTQPFITLAPDWICEVLSPSTSSVDRVRKMPVYQRECVSSAWIIDPRKPTLEVYHLGPGGWRLAAWHAGDSVVRAEPYEAVPLDLARLWSARVSRPLEDAQGP